MTIENTMPPYQPGHEIVLKAVVPEHDRRNPLHNDWPNEYAVEYGHDIPGGCIIWGVHYGKWVANVSARWLVMALIRSCWEWRRVASRLAEMLAAPSPGDARYAERIIKLTEQGDVTQGGLTMRTKPLDGILFVGGPMDGERIDVPPFRREFCVLVKNGSPRIGLEGADFRQLTYVRKEFLYAGKTFEVFAVDGMPLGHVMEMLLQNYRP